MNFFRFCLCVFAYAAGNRRCVSPYKQNGEKRNTMYPKNKSAVKMDNGNLPRADTKVSIIYTPSREDCKHGYHLATKARFAGLQAEHGNRVKKVAVILHDPDADMVYVIDEVE